MTTAIKLPGIICPAKPDWAQCVVGQQIVWTSGGAGQKYEKIGTIVAHLSADISFDEFKRLTGDLYHDVTKYRKFDYIVSHYDRYLVAVPRRQGRLATKPGLVDYYAPTAAVIHKSGRLYLAPDPFDADIWSVEGDGTVLGTRVLNSAGEFVPGVQQVVALGDGLMEITLLRRCKPGILDELHMIDVRTSRPEPEELAVASAQEGEASA